jgi:hypothetical protein
MGLFLIPLLWAKNRISYFLTQIFYLLLNKLIMVSMGKLAPLFGVSVLMNLLKYSAQITSTFNTTSTSSINIPSITTNGK